MNAAKAKEQQTRSERMSALFYEFLDNSFKHVLFGTIVGLGVGLVLRKPKLFCVSGAGVAFGLDVNRTRGQMIQVAKEFDVRRPSAVDVDRALQGKLKQQLEKLNKAI